MYILRLIFAISISYSLLFSKVKLGIDNLLEDKNLYGKNIILCTNYASITGDLEKTLDKFINSKNFNLKAICSPEHGLFISELEAEGHGINKYKGLDVYNIHCLYSNTYAFKFKIDPKKDIFICDLQDIGVRDYTHVSTMMKFMKIAKKYNSQIIVTDRPNPLGGLTIDGPLLENKNYSVLAEATIPLIHGMTIGELAQLINEERNINANLKIYKMNNWTRNMKFEDTKLTWIPTSPNIPNYKSAQYFAITTGIAELIEGVSNGLGTTVIFRIIGAEWIDGDILAKTLNALHLKGVYFHNYFFKDKGKLYNGVLISITGEIKPFEIKLAIINSIKKIYPDKFKEGRQNRNKQKEKMFGLVIGSKKIENLLLKDDCNIKKIKLLINKDIYKFKKYRNRFLLYN